AAYPQLSVRFHRRGQADSGDGARRRAKPFTFAVVIFVSPFWMFMHRWLKEEDFYVATLPAAICFHHAPSEIKEGILWLATRSQIGADEADLVLRHHPWN